MLERDLGQNYIHKIYGMNIYNIGADPYTVLLYRCCDNEGWIFLLPNSINYLPHSAREVDLKVGINEDLRKVGIGITFGVLEILNATP